MEMMLRLWINLLICTVVRADRIINTVASQQYLRRTNEELPPTNDMIEMQFETYNCNGTVLGWDLDNSSTDDLFTKVVEFDYDLLVKKGSDVTSALTNVQATLLRHVGKDVVSDCSIHRLREHELRLTRSLAIGSATSRQLENMVIKEISTVPADTILSTSNCKVESNADADCYPISGSISVYYMSSGDFVADVSSIDKAVKESVKGAIANGALITDTSAVYYLGDREIYSLDQSTPESSIDSSSALASTENASAGVPWWILSTIGGLLLILAAGLWFWFKKKSSSRKVVVNPIEKVISIEKDDEECTRNSFIIEKFDDGNMSDMTEEKNKTDATCIGLPSQCEVVSPTCNMFGCLHHDEDVSRTVDGPETVEDPTVMNTVSP
jgi:hypothetical protein